MKVLSINVSLPKEVEWEGRKISTSIFKTPVVGRRRVARLNIEGDGQSDLMAHGGEHRAVFVYQEESYDYWRGVLGRDDLHYGQFGENLTVEGLADSEVCIGDRFQIGTVVFEVTQPRVTCYKVALSTGVREMPALLVSHKRPGFYFRVIVEGEMEAGDEIVKIVGGEGGMTVAEVDGLLYSSAHPADRLRRALEVGALSAGWRGSLQALYDAAVSGVASGNAGLAPAAMVAAWEGFRSFVVDSIVRESEGVCSIGLRPADGAELPVGLAGQHIVVRIPVGGGTGEGGSEAGVGGEGGEPGGRVGEGGEPGGRVGEAGGRGGVLPIRMYSLCGPAGEKYYRIAVKAERNGVGSNYLNHRLAVGDVLEVSAPRGSFTLLPGDRPLVLMGAGIGITPLLAMLYAVAKDRVVWWIYTTQNKGHYPFRSEVKMLSAGLGSFHEYTLFTRPQTGDVIGEDYNGMGRPTVEGLRGLNLPLDGDYYLCGPAGFMAGGRAALRTLGVPDPAIRQEAFGNAGVTDGVKGAPHVPVGGVGSGPMVVFAKSGVSCPWDGRWGSLLEAAEACDVPVSWSCRVGVCHRCETTVFSGEVRYVGEPLDRPAEGNVLICCSVPRTEVQLDL